ncbi:MAG: hypothetical protein J0M04_13645 [Verrucomicrobia bacterium]|nr:hypothetical protein [Verrucomicrobiota bacterium]
MQRWIIAAAAFMVLFLVLGAFGYRTYQQNRNTRIWLPLPAVEASPEQRKEMADTLKKKLTDPETMAAVCRDSGFAKTFGFSSEEEAVKSLLTRFFCEIGTADTSNGKVPSINVGFNCKVKEFHKMDKVTGRLREDILKILGVPEGGGDGGAF